LRPILQLAIVSGQATSRMSGENVLKLIPKRASPRVGGVLPNLAGVTLRFLHPVFNDSALNTGNRWHEYAVFNDFGARAQENSRFVARISGCQWFMGPADAENGAYLRYSMEFPQVVH
ncbi:MAG: hypothetical protein IJH04_01415, partial [Eggerthellaceae bacterium]|nr:hypothetical protein [Eggerthellaceae bacterium]